MRLIHVIPHVDNEASGPSYSVPRLCQALATRGNEVELSCLAVDGDIPGVRVALHRQWPVLRRFAPSPSHAVALRRKAAQVEIVHNHSLWSMVNVAAGWVVPVRGAKLVTSPRGTLSPWALNHSRNVKRVVWPLQRRILERADLLHATSEAEYREIRDLRFPAPVTVIPNGIDLPAASPETPTHGKRTLLFLGRIHPTKGIDRLLRAWGELEDVHSDWRLIVVGEGELAYRQELEELVRSLGLKRAEFPGPAYGDAKSRRYRAAELFVLPTHSENFGMVVAEALAHGCPVVVTKGAPWKDVEREDCGWWIENRVEALASALHTALSCQPEVLARMGQRGRQWMEREFSWESVAARMEAAYRWVEEGGTPPDSIRLD